MLEKKEAELAHEIVSKNLHKAALGLYIDFAHKYLDIVWMQDSIEPEVTLTYYKSGTET